jgi:hypothetical protein
MAALGWMFATVMKRYAIADAKSRTAPAGYEALGSTSVLFTSSLPKISILLPVAGRRPNTLANWRTLLTLPYPGTLEIILLVHARSDAAFVAAQELLLGQESMSRARRCMRVCVTGLAETCSQKVHKCGSVNTTVALVQGNLRVLELPEEHVRK